MKSAFEAAMESPVLNEHPERAKALALAVEGARFCKPILEGIGVPSDVSEKYINETYALVRGTMDACESPIECVMLSSLVFADWTPCLSIPAGVYVPDGVFPKTDVVVAPQFRVGPYRLDFLVIGYDENFRHNHWINVECDGRDFHAHNITQKDWDADRERDKFVRACGAEVFRFTGSEIWENATACAQRVTIAMARWREGLPDGGR